MARSLPLLILADPQGLTCGRALVWCGSLGGVSVQHRQLMTQQLDLAANQFGPVGVAMTTCPCEFWSYRDGEELPPIRRRALAFLAEAAARGMQLPVLQVGYKGWHADEVTCLVPAYERGSRLGLELQKQLCGRAVSSR